MTTLAPMEAEGEAALGRLLAYRRPKLAATAGTVRPELKEVLQGGALTDALVRRLAPALGWRTADLFVIAGLDLPRDLVPANGTKPWDVGSILEKAARLAPQSLRRLHEFVRSLPERPPAWPPALPRHAYPLGPGEMMLRLLRNRNIRPYSPKVLYFIGNGPIVSHSTMAMLGPGRTKLTPQYVTAFATVLGIPADELAAVTGVAAAVDPMLHGNHAELAELAWAARRLDGNQLAEALELATELR
ncbi:hypothetical protein ACWT_3793 [Actinoplanes sp. SE50]|uniref:hypothetical protein n=1 Tax=unclassified Actinoplanes TaxID=2626549 RepID=UPI00023ECCB8|nr:MULTISPECIES: hypothetical protein [unclassified Actinoplanes]AEV84816.1 hypothetical protein ACPL_3921 [Actinoplanes sp. SE50/110]ATO83208.1 hypothetical protein ACWT_3793 [Actinoplanes sp. SE50]SLM00615.1 hypothetical protein ACSP50_3848 [Actinoplanes sp. SE50/110]